MSPLLHNFAFSQHYDIICFLDGRQTVGNADRCAVLCSSVQRHLHLLLSTDIHGTGSLVENEDLGLFDNASCYGQPLSLTATEFSA